MSATATWARRHWPELAWGLFAAANFAVMFALLQYQTVPFHFVWVSLTLLYGFRVWRTGPTFAVLFFVCLVSAAALGQAVQRDASELDELTEIPLMSAMFLAMVWHAQRRQSALDAAARAAERERGFIRDASHQLKTPIAVSRGLAELIRQGRSPADERYDLEELVDELDRLGNIAEQLVLLQVAEQPGSLVRAPVDVEDLIVSAVRRWSRGAERRWQVDVGVDGYIDGDRDRLDSALDAVMENAVQATDETDAVSVTAAPEVGGVLITVSDTGVGIPPELLPRVFDRFSRGRAPRKRGTGLGLPIVRAIIDAHGGTVTARSGPGAGTRIAIHLPGPLTSGPVTAQAHTFAGVTANVTVHDAG
jgi:signal transduction histidine kinase